MKYVLKVSNDSMIQLEDDKLTGDEDILYFLRSYANLYDGQYVGYYPNTGTYKAKEHLKDIWSITILLDYLKLNYKLIEGTMPKLWYEIPGIGPTKKEPF